MSLRHILQSKPEASAFLMLMFLTLVFSLLSPAFMTYGNFQVVLQPIPEIALVAMGVTILMISGEFDLSVGSVFALAPMVMVLAMAAGIPLPISMLAGLIAAAVVGLVNAAITIRLGLPSFIATLGMLFMARSLTIVISGGFPPPFPRDLDLWWIVGKVDLLRVSIFWLLGVGLLLGIWLRKFDFGSWIFATGGNREAARDMGINTNLVKTTAFVLCSVMAGFAGMIQVFRIKAIVPSMGTGLELTAIAAAVIGGAALTGGIGSVVGAVIGALLIAFIENIIILTRIDANWFRFAVGAMIVIAVTINKITRDAAGRGKHKDGNDE
ncbi:ribose/xylose/arabinose/galactoside ABC-type transport system permease subunit [Labrenzia sp. EL_126]|nr:ribose/xylose/arabinose/galactoside ABC-type transport system permease subunit [Labrenzia sp. EL_126]